MLSISIVMTILIGRTVYKMNNEQIHSSIVTLTEMKAQEVEKQLSNMVYTAETLSGTLGGTWAIPPRQRRSAVEQEIRALVKSTQIDSAWAYWIPNMFDNRDAEKVDMDNNPSGQFKVHYIKDRSGKIKNETVSELTSQEIVDRTNTWATTLSEPKEILLDGQKVLSIKAFSKIINSLGQSVGVAGVDLVLKNLEGTLDGSNIYKNTVCQFLTSNGKVIASSDGSRTNSTSKYFTDSKLKSYFINEDGSVNWDNSSFYTGSGKDTQFVAIARTTVDNAGTVWYFTSSTPVSEINKSTIATISNIVVAFVLQIMIVLGIVWFSVTKLTKPLKDSVKALKNISEGDGDLTVRLSANHNNEIGEMAESFNKTMGKIGDSIKEVKVSSDEMSNVGQELNNSMDETASAIETITGSIQSVQNQMQEYSAGVEEAKAVVEQIVKNIYVLNENIDDQAASVEQSSRSIEEMTGNIASVSQILQKNKASMDSLESASELGQALINQTASLSTEIEGKSQHLSEASLVIKTIASQTNLLAMNAAIEAAHAGKEGQGFAVVADEIRKLAEESSVQGTKIQTALKEVSDIIQSVTKSTQAVQQQFNTIFDLTKVVSEQETEIDQAMQQQNQNSEQILDAMKQINSITQNVKSGSNEMMEGSKQVSYEMDSIAKMTGTVNSNMKDMSSKTELITSSAQKANECVSKNTESIRKLKEAMDKFKVE
ncbi:MAG: HAMP domain-containing protein [Treponema sp.]|nr:HAMP domain-containing protein [Treponema sp.]